MSREAVRELVGSLPRWARSPHALTIVVLLVAVPVLVSLLRAPHFETRFEVFPTTPAGNASVSSDYGLAVRGIVANPGFEADAKGWAGHGACTPSRSSRQAHSGRSSLACVRSSRTSPAERAATTRVVLPAPGRYRVRAWVRLPRGYRGGSPRVELDGFSGSRRVATREADPRVHERWQSIFSDYVVESYGVKGEVVLRSDPPLPRRGQVLYWDDVGLLSSNDASLPRPRRVNLVPNSSFEYDTSGWGDPPAFKAERSLTIAHSGDASLRTSSDRRALRDTNAAYTYLAFPRAGTYRAEAWVYLPRKRNARSDPVIFLEGFSGATQLAQRRSNPKRRGTWQRIATDYAISSKDLEGSFVLRDVAGLTRPGRRVDTPRVIYLDDVNVGAPRPKPPRNALGPGRTVQAALKEPQLRFEVSLLARDKNLYDPDRATVLRSSRQDTLSFIVRVASDVPSDARSLAGPLRSALVRAATRSTLRRTQATLQQLITRLGRELPLRRRGLLQRRADVLQGMIGAQASDVVALPASMPARSATKRRAELRAEQRAQRDRQKIIARLGRGLPRRQRALVQQRADDVQRVVGAHIPEFVVLRHGSLPKPTRPVDRLVDKLPGPYPARVGPAWAGAAGLISALLLLGVVVATTAVRHRAAARGR